MTTPWQPNGEWAGETVAVLGTGPNMSQAVADMLNTHRCIVVNDAYKLAPWADMLVALDMGSHFDAGDFAGRKVAGSDVQGLDALYAGPFWERVRFSPVNEVEIRNSGLAAIRIAARMGAAKIILAGFAPESRGHFYDDEVDTGDTPAPYFGVPQALEALIAELAAQGVKVEYAAEKKRGK